MDKYEENSAEKNDNKQPMTNTLHDIYQVLHVGSYVVAIKAKCKQHTQESIEWAAEQDIEKGDNCSIIIN